MDCCLAICRALMVFPAAIRATSPMTEARVRASCRATLDRDGITMAQEVFGKQGSFLWWRITVYVKTLKSKCQRNTST